MIVFRFGHLEEIALARREEKRRHLAELRRRAADQRYVSIEQYQRRARRRAAK